MTNMPSPWVTVKNLMKNGLEIPMWLGILARVIQPQR